MTALVINKDAASGFTASDKDIARCASKAQTMVGKARTLANDARILGSIALIAADKGETAIDGVKVFTNGAQRSNFTKGLHAILMGPAAKPLAAIDADVLDLVITNGRLVETTKCDLGRKVRDEIGLIVIRTALGHTKADAANARHLTAALTEVGADTLTAANFAEVKSAFNASRQGKTANKATKAKGEGITLEQVLAFLAVPENTRQAVDAGMLNHLVSAYAKDMGVLQQAMLTAANG